MRFTICRAMYQCIVKNTKLAVSGTSVPSERISSAGDLLTAQRDTLNFDRVDWLFIKKDY